LRQVPYGYISLPKVKTAAQKKNNENSKHENIVFYSGKICIGVQIGFSKIKDFYSAQTEPLLRQQHLSICIICRAGHKIVISLLATGTRK
jgi:hypothetical protein